MTEAGWTRERKLVDELLTFIEQTSGRKIKFSAIANLKTGVIEDPQDRIAAWLKRHLADSYRQGRVAGLREAGDLHEQVNTYCDHEPKAGAGGMGVAIRYRDLIRQRAAKLAQQAQEGGVGDVHC